MARAPSQPRNHLPRPSRSPASIGSPLRSICARWTKPARFAKRFWRVRKSSSAAGFHDQVKVTHETTLLFYKVAGRREPLRSRNGKFIAGEYEFTSDQLCRRSSSVAGSHSLRARFCVRSCRIRFCPTAAYFGGPAEVAYMAQSQVVYRKILGHMPAILPRASFTIIEPPIARFLTQYGLEIRDILAGPQHLRAKMEQKSLPAALASRFDETEYGIRAMIKAYEEPLGAPRFHASGSLACRRAQNAASDRAAQGKSRPRRKFPLG